MELELSTEDVVELTTVLDNTIRNLSPEIADTDDPDYRAMLRQRRERLRAIREKLNG
jgi:hypothetical protein